MTSHRPTAPWPAKMTDAPQPTNHLPKLPPGNNSLLTPNSLVPDAPSDPHVTKRPGRVTDDTLVAQASNTKRKMSSLNGPSENLSSDSALSSTSRSTDIDIIEQRLDAAARERRALRDSYKSQQALLRTMKEQLQEVNRRWKTETSESPPNPNPPGVIHTGSQASPYHQNAHPNDSTPPSPNVSQPGSRRSRRRRPSVNANAHPIDSTPPSPNVSQTGSRRSRRGRRSVNALKHHQNAPPTNFRLTHLEIKNVQDHHGLWFRTNDLVWKPGAKAYYTSTSPPRSNDVDDLTLSMIPVYIVGQNAEYPPSYEVSDVRHPGDDQVWTLCHKDLWTPVKELNQAKIDDLLETSRLANLHSTYFNAGTFRKSTLDLTLDSDHVSNVRAFYEAICSALKTSHSLSKSILPQFGDLQPNVPIKRMMVPGSKIYTNENAKHFVEVISQAIFTFLK